MEFLFIQIPGLELFLQKVVQRLHFHFSFNKDAPMKSASIIDTEIPLCLMEISAMGQLLHPGNDSQVIYVHRNISASWEGIDSNEG